MSLFCFYAEEDSVKDRTEQEQLQDSCTDELERNDAFFSDSAISDEIGKSTRMKREDGNLRTLSGRVFSCQGKNLRMNIPLTTPSRTLSAISYLVWDDLVNQSSKKCGPEGSKLHINKSKLHHAEKMIKGALIELYKGLGYLKTYRYHHHNSKSRKYSFYITEFKVRTRALPFSLCYNYDFQALEHACFYKNSEEA